MWSLSISLYKVFNFIIALCRSYFPGYCIEYEIYKWGVCLITRSCYYQIYAYAHHSIFEGKFDKTISKTIHISKRRYRICEFMVIFSFPSFPPVFIISIQIAVVRTKWSSSWIFKKILWF